MLKIDHMRLRAGKDNVFDYESVERHRLTKGERFGTIREYFEFYGSAGSELDVYQRVEGFSLAEWQDMRRSGEILLGRFVRGRVRFVLREDADRFAAFRHDETQPGDERVTEAIGRLGRATFRQLIAATGVFIPVAPALLDLIENEQFLAKPTTTAKPPDVRFLTRLPKAFVASRPVQDALVSKAIALLADYFKLFERSVAFPELAYPVARSLKAYAKRCKVSQWSSAAKALATKLMKQAEEVIREREGIAGSPMQMQNKQVERKHEKK